MKFHVCLFFFAAVDGIIKYDDDIEGFSTTQGHLEPVESPRKFDTNSWSLENASISINFLYATGFC
jgi:hypothetical protein